MRIIDWSSDVCSSDLPRHFVFEAFADAIRRRVLQEVADLHAAALRQPRPPGFDLEFVADHCIGRPGRSFRRSCVAVSMRDAGYIVLVGLSARSEEHTSELQSLMRTSFAVFCLKTKKTSQ